MFLLIKAFTGGMKIIYYLSNNRDTTQKVWDNNFFEKDKYAS